MLESIQREKYDYFTYFQKYLDSTIISDDDRNILNVLKDFITDDAIMNYCDAINDYCLDSEKIKRNNTIISPDKLDKFWRTHKIYLISLLEDSKACPVCGLSYIKSYGYFRTIEHVLPKSEYQQYTLSPINLVYFCNFCNGRRGNEVSNDRIFHPLFSNINCSSETNVELFLRADSKVDIKVTINEPNADFLHFIKKIFKIHLKYKNYISHLFYKVIDSVEVAIVGKLIGLNLDSKYEVVSKYLKGNLLLTLFSQNVQTETENMILLKLNNLVEIDPILFARYIVENSTILKNC